MWCVAIVDDDENLFFCFISGYLWNFIWMFEDGDEDDEEEDERWRKLKKLRYWWCAIRFIRHALSNGCGFEKKNQTININQINEVFSGPLAMCIHFRHCVNGFDGGDLFGWRKIT